MTQIEAERLDQALLWVTAMHLTGRCANDLTDVSRRNSDALQLQKGVAQSDRLRCCIRASNQDVQRQLRPVTSSQKANCLRIVSFTSEASSSLMASDLSETSHWTINVLLPTGRCEAVRLPGSACVSELLVQLVASGAVTGHALRLTRAGANLDPAASLESAGLGDGDTVSGVKTATALHGAVNFEVVLPSGRSAKLKANQEGSIEQVRQDAQQILGEAFLKLVTDGGLPLDSLDPKLPLYTAGLKDDDSLTAIAQPVRLAASARAFAFWPLGGQVVTWGDPTMGGDMGNPTMGGDMGSVRDQLRCVQHVEANRRAFAAIRTDGSVATWGNASSGGDSSRVQDRLKEVVQICAVDDGAFAALLADGHVVTWGQPSFGGDSSSVQDQLKEVKEIRATAQACAAIRADGTLITWGHLDAGRDIRQVQSKLVQVQQVCGSQRAFAAIVKDGDVVTWGKEDVDFGADSGSVQDQLKQVRQLTSSLRAFCAIKADGSIVTWGDPAWGGDSSKVQDQLRDVQRVTASSRAFAALLKNGTVVTWGDAKSGADSSQVSDRLKNVQQLHATHGAFVALLADGSVVTWGDPAVGGQLPQEYETMQVQELTASTDSFAAVGSHFLGEGGYESRHPLARDSLGPPFKRPTIYQRVMTCCSEQYEGWDGGHGHPLPKGMAVWQFHAVHEACSCSFTLWQEKRRSM
eukprot:s352_g39.t1